MSEAEAALFSAQITLMRLDTCVWELKREYRALTQRKSALRTTMSEGRAALRVGIASVVARRVDPLRYTQRFGEDS